MPNSLIVIIRCGSFISLTEATDAWLHDSELLQYVLCVLSQKYEPVSVEMISVKQWP